MLPDHYSHSQINAWLRCGKQYELERIRKVPRTPSVYLVAGNAIHTAIEQLNLRAFQARSHPVQTQHASTT